MTDLKLQDIVLKAVKNLKNKSKLEGVRLSSNKSDSGIFLSEVNERELTDYISKITNIAYLYGIEAAKDSWHEVNGLARPIINAGIIELGKIIPYLPHVDKNQLYKLIGVKIGENTTIAPRVQFDYFHPELIEIGSNSLIGDSAKIWTHDYDLDHLLIGAVKIGNNVRIGSESVIGPGTTIEDNVRVNFGAFLYMANVHNGSIIKGRERSRY